MRMDYKPAKMTCGQGLNNNLFVTLSERDVEDGVGNHQHTSPENPSAVTHQVKQVEEEQTTNGNET